MSGLGSKLRDARIEKGYTLNTLQQKTKIQKKYLQAIEDGNFQEMPGQFYVRAFVKQYADVVGLNGDQLLLDYEDEFVEPVEKENNYQNQDNPDIPSRLERHSQTENSKFENFLSYLPMITLVGIILLIIGTLIFAIQSMGNNEEKVVVNEKNSPEVVTVVEPDKVEIDTDKTKKNNNKDKKIELKENQIKVGDAILTLVSDPTGETVYEMDSPVDSYEFEVKADNFVWVGIYEDEVMKVDTPAAAGESVKFTPQKGVQSVRVRLGYPEGGTIYVNGVKIEPKSDYIKETILFNVPSGTENNTSLNTMELELPTNESTAQYNETTVESGYQGPAVYAPNGNE